MRSSERHDGHRTGLALALAAALEPRMPALNLGALVPDLAEALRNAVSPVSDEARRRHAAMASRIATCERTRHLLIRRLGRPDLPEWPASPPGQAAPDAGMTAPAARVPAVTPGILALVAEAGLDAGRGERDRLGAALPPSRTGTRRRRRFRRGLPAVSG